MLPAIQFYPSVLQEFSLKLKEKTGYPAKAKTFLKKKWGAAACAAAALLVTCGVTLKLRQTSTLQQLELY